MKFIIVSGGVLSGLGKGITAASIGLGLKARGIKVTAIKCDMYLNIDAGTMNPLEHGEVFVTHDGLETDLDLGHYERFLNTTLYRENYLTNGQIYRHVIGKERALEYHGVCVQPYHHIPPEIIKRWQVAGRRHGAQVVLVEFGGTVGEYEGLLFFEAARRLKLKYPGDVCLVHVGYLPFLPSSGELKSKPLQQSISMLNSLGLQPDFIVARATKSIDRQRKEKIALASGLPLDHIISNPDLDSVYRVPIELDRQSLISKIVKKLGLKKKKKNLKEWQGMLKRIKKSKERVKVGIVGKYQKTGDYILEDSYACVVEALKHAGWQNLVTPEIVWIDSEKLERTDDADLNGLLSGLEGILVPQGWGSRGAEGKIKAVRYARENKIPYLGLCFGMQMAAIEFARNVLGYKDANTTEINPETKHPVVHIMPSQVEYLKKGQYGGTIRLGAWPCKVKNNSKLKEIYKKHGDVKNAPWYLSNPALKKAVRAEKAKLVYERHRHRYEFNNKYIRKFEKAGMVFCGTSPDGKLVEAIEVLNHPFFLATQFHPEYLSRPLAPHPIFVAYIEAMKACKK